jgi:hypothetical protein
MPGLRASASAAVPLTYGVAIEVPLMSIQRPPG